MVMTVIFRTLPFPFAVTMKHKGVGHNAMSYSMVTLHVIML